MKFDYDKFVPKSSGEANKLNTLLSNSFVGQDELDFKLPAAISNPERNVLDLHTMMMSYKELALREKDINTAASQGAGKLAGETTAGPSIKALMDLMATTSMLDYLLHLTYLLSFLFQYYLQQLQ